MHPILLKIGSFSLYSYGFMLVIAFSVAIGFSLYFAKKENVQRDVIIEIAIIVILAAIIGSRFLYVIYNWGFNGVFWW